MKTASLAPNCKSLLLAMSLLMGAVSLPAVATDGDILDFNTTLQQAQQGDAIAQYNLGVIYAEGKGVRQDDVEAVNWYRKAADQGLAVAQYNLGVMYDNGRGILQNDIEAVNWYRKAAEQGLAAAQFNLGVRYYTGEGIRQNDAEAVNWYRRAADQGLVDAQYSLGSCMLMAEVYAKTIAKRSNGLVKLLTKDMLTPNIILG